MTEQEQVQLLPCPFCGGEAKYEAGGEWQYYDAWSVECRECGASLSGNADMRVSGASAKAEAITSWNTRHTATAEALEAMREAQHMASDLLQHIDWLTNGLPAMLENGGLTDEEGLIGAAVDAANSGRVTLIRLTAAIAKIEGQQQ
jgi:Lar family restriction alleviation protein